MESWPLFPSGGAWGEFGQEMFLGVCSSGLYSFRLFFPAESWSEAALFLVRWLEGDLLSAMVFLIWVAMSLHE